MNLFYLHRKFRYIIQETNYKFYFDNMDNVCSEGLWKLSLTRNFEVLIKEVKHFHLRHPDGKLQNNYCDYLLFYEKKNFQWMFKKHCPYTQFFCIFVFVNAAAILNVKEIIVFYVLRLQPNLQMTKFFTRIF